MLKNCTLIMVCLAILAVPGAVGTHIAVEEPPVEPKVKRIGQQPGKWPESAALAAFVGISDAVPQGRGLTNTSSSPFVKFRAVDIDAVKWTRGFWADRFALCREVMVPNMWRLLSDPNVSHAYANFRIAAGLAEGRHRGPPWSDGDLYKWLEAAASGYAVARDEELDRLMDEVIAVIEQAQREDGYIHTSVIIKRRLGDSQARPFQDRLDFEMYNFGHLMTAACIHHRATGKPTLLNIAKKACDYLDSVFEHPTPELAENAVCPSHYMGMVEMYRTTRDRKYLELAKKFIDMRDLVAHGTDDNQDRIPFRRQTKAVGHAVRANYLYAGAADVYAETGDRSLLDALEKIWANVVFQKMYITGATGALYDGASPYGAKDQKSISRVHQAYGREYQLPNTTAHNETCANVANAMWNWRMLQISGDARFADVMELVIYNGALSGISLDGKKFFYTNTLRQVEDLPFELRWSRKREPYISCFCCPPNIVRMIAQVGNYAYSLTDDGVCVTLYGSSVLDTVLADGSPVRLSQQTDYPWDGRVRITVSVPQSKEFSILLRIPGWATGATVTVNGESVPAAPASGEYVTIRRKWSDGDVVELNLPMRVRLMEAHPLVEELRNQVAVKRGPIVYCLESSDLPKNVTVSEIVVPRDIRLRPRFDRNLLGGVTVLEGQAQYRKQSDWTDVLYRELPQGKPKAMGITLVPYYAWGNRGSSEMTVWMPVR